MEIIVKFYVLDFEDGVVYYLYDNISLNDSNVELAHGTIYI